MKNKEYHAAGSTAPAAAPGPLLAAVRHRLRPTDDYLAQTRACREVAALPRAELGLRPLRVALLASSSLEHFAPVLQLWLRLEGFDPTLELAPFDTLRAQVLDPASALYRFAPDVAVLLPSARDAGVTVPQGASLAAVEAEVAARVEEWAALWQSYRRHGGTRLVQANVVVPDTQPLGNLAGGVAWGETALLQRFNLRLADAASTAGASQASLALFDLDHLASRFGKARWVEPRYWYHSRHAFAFDAYGLVAHALARLLGAQHGRARRACVVDLDNTLWGGTIGDDGLAGIDLGSAAGEAFLDFQDYLLSLRRRGVLLAVASKNDPATARLPFEQHPSMRLRLGDFAAFHASWEDKAASLRAIAAELNLGLDALAFVDDSAHECGLVRELLPAVAVVELPDDPAEYVGALDRLRLFETVGLTEEDRTRTEMVRADAARREHVSSQADLDGYLRSLDMVAGVAELDAVRLPRAVQLLNKTNQFNLTGERTSEAETLRFLEQPGAGVRCYTLADRFGDNGMVSVVVLRVEAETLGVLNWVTSCRVFSRTLEDFVLLDLLESCRQRGLTRITARYLDSGRNAVARATLERLGFRPNSDALLWTLDVVAATALVTHVRRAA